MSDEELLIKEKEDKEKLIKAIRLIKEELYGEELEGYEYDVEQNIKDIIKDLEKEIGEI